MKMENDKEIICKLQKENDELAREIDDLKKWLLEAQQAKEEAMLKVKRLRSRLAWAAEGGL